MKLWLLLLVSYGVQAALPTAGDEVLPFKSDAYPLRQLVKDYAELTQTHLQYDRKTLEPGATVRLHLNQKTSRAEFKKIFYSLLANEGLTVMEEQGFSWIANSRDIRYMPGPIYTNDQIPANSSYGLLVHTLKYPLGDEVTRNMRPHVSRYGRAINFSDAHTIMLHDQGTNLTRLLLLVQSLDTEVGYQNLLKLKPREKEEDLEMKEKIVELQMDNKLLEKKYLELREKEAQRQGGGDQ